MTKAIHIDPKTRIVQEIFLKTTSLNICNVIDSESFIGLYPQEAGIDMNYILFVDDSVLYRELDEVPNAFEFRMFGDRLIYGKAVLVAYKAEKAIRQDVDLSYQEVADQIRFEDREFALKKLILKREEQVKHFLF